jgi:hypothetical protein
MDKFLKIQLYFMRNESHLQYFIELLEYFAKYPAVAALVTALLNKLIALVSLEEAISKETRKNSYTEQIELADVRMDHAIDAIYKTVAAAINHFDPAIREAARKVEIRLQSFSGSIKLKKYEDEQAAVRILLNSLNGDFKDETVLLNLNGWIMELTASLENFGELFTARNDKEAAKIAEKMRALRKQIDATYRLIVLFIDSYTNINGNTLTGMFLSQVNEKITYYNNHNARNHRIDLVNAIVENIPDQQYNGEPVVVYPVVYFEGKKLFFPTDYTLTYRNNKEPGTAMVVIHGKGLYRGRKIVSFNIIRSLGLAIFRDV